MKLTNKVILIISPQAWGNMYLAKHHYAMELAKLGNEVYFMNPREKQKTKNEVEIVNSNILPSLFLIFHKIPFPYIIKFKWIGLFHFLIRFHIKKIEKKIGKKIDIVWNFDLGYSYPFKFFSSATYKIFMPLDTPANKVGFSSAKGADIIISVTKEILEKYKKYDIPKYLLNHGLSSYFINPVQLENVKDNIIRIGLSGNWLRKDIDTKCLLQIVEENPNVIFEFWGSYQQKQSNIGGGSDEEAKHFINSLLSKKNVIFHGTVHPKELAVAYQRMNGFLICYDILKDQSQGTNYHKIMEYLSTGKVIISSNITSYSNLPELISMTPERNSNQNLPKLFKKIISEIDHCNTEYLQKARINFAQANSYSNNIKTIENILEDPKYVSNIF